jgi:hypothetical protein
LLSQLRKTALLCNSTIFKYINAIGVADGAETMGDRTPDAAWVELSRWQALTLEHHLTHISEANFLRGLKGLFCKSPYGEVNSFSVWNLPKHPNAE